MECKEMDFDLLSKEQSMMVDSINELLKKEYPLEKAREDDINETFPHDLYKKLAELGFFSIPFPEIYGGMGGSSIDECLAIETLAKHGASISISYFLSVCFGGKTLEYLGSEQQKKEYLTKLCSGEKMYSLALTEPDGGTDVLGAMTTTFDKDGENYILNGQKMFITGATVADYLIVVGRTNKDVRKQSEGISVFVVDQKSPGIEIKNIEKMGIRAAPTAIIYFDDVKVPAENILGDEGKGWYGIVNTLNNERTGIAALCTGLAQGILSLVLKYSKERIAFGKPIGQFQALQHYLADISTKLDAARLLTYRAAWLQKEERPNSIESAKAKLFASEVALKAAEIGMRVMGGAGYMMEYDMQRFYRDAPLFLFAPISNEMCKNFIGEKELKLPRSF